MQRTDRARFSSHRRRFLRTGAAGVVAGALAPWLQGCATVISDSTRINLTSKLTKAISAARSRPPLLASSPRFFDHVNRGAGSGVTLGGVDYAPLPDLETEICPVAGGMVVGAHDQNFSGGMELIIAHGLGWKTQYSHLKARFVGYRDSVSRRDVIALMGSSGWGATRGGLGVAIHTHLTLWGPAFTPLFKGVAVQNWTSKNPGYRNVLDPEEFSIGGKEAFLFYPRPEDATHDQAFMAKHLEAVTLCDHLLDRLGDADTTKAKARERWETETRFDYNVDQRIWFLWQRIEKGPHPFSPSQVEEYRSALLDFMATVPRLTAPIVEPARRAEYRVLRARPLKVYEEGHEIK